MPIQPLPPEVVNLIAAGEVIDSLAAAVRELVENALDAGATHISISLSPEAWRVQVADNGRGMSLADLHQCAQPHSTSKIFGSDDLWKITSLGFRGEALHSLAQVAELEIASRPSDGESAIGYCLRFDTQGNLENEAPTAIAPGTIITASNLFGNFPVRRKGLPPLTQQLKAVQATIQQIALCHPQVTWQVWQEGQSWFSLSPGRDARDLLPQILKQVQYGDLQYLAHEIEVADAASQPSSLELVLGLPDRCHRRRPDWVKVAVNGRMVRCTELEQAILGAFARTLPRHRFPVCFLHLKVCPSQIDWNRHPAKAEIYLHSLEFWREQVLAAIAEALHWNAAALPTEFRDRRLGQLLKAAEGTGDYQIQPVPVKPGEASSDIGLMELRAVAQVRNTYIVAEHPAGLWLVEQHIAHERVLYEQLQADWQLVPLETPIVLSQLGEAQLEQLELLGLEIEPFGEQLWAVRTAPEMLVQRDDCQAALLELSWGGDLEAAQVAISCRSAIRNGMPLSLPEMQALLDRWKVTRHPRTCPHGRPIYLSLEETALARFFRRHWVIGKSHGLSP
jgi:DNA mismatch repair protein MutL